jgi:MoaA/NifB/PqqE/SkfB family radical SAM enzyme
MAALVRNSVRFGVKDARVLYQRRALNHPTKMPPVDVPALLKALENTGKVFRVTFTGGGEPLLIPNIVEAARALAEKHYLSFNTNLTSPRFKDLVKEVPREKLFIHASFHTRELERKKLMGRFIENFRFGQERGIEIYAQEVAHPSLLPDVEHYRGMLRDNGIVLSFGPFHGEYQGRTYPASYTEEEIQGFNLGRKGAKGAQFSQKGNLCNAGYNAVSANGDGQLTPCRDVRENLGNMFGEIRFQPEVRRCPVDACTCPVNFYDEPLFKLALSERKQRLGTAGSVA